MTDYNGHVYRVCVVAVSIFHNLKALHACMQLAVTNLYYSKHLTRHSVGLLIPYPLRFGRSFTLCHPLESYRVFYVGGESPTLSNLMINYSQCQVSMLSALLSNTMFHCSCKLWLHPLTCSVYVFVSHYIFNLKL